MELQKAKPLFDINVSVFKIAPNLKKQRDAFAKKYKRLIEEVIESEMATDLGKERLKIIRTTTKENEQGGYFESLVGHIVGKLRERINLSLDTEKITIAASAVREALKGRIFEMQNV